MRATVAALLGLTAGLACAGAGDTDTRTSATGVLLYEPTAAEGTDRAAFLATQAEIAESDAIAERVATWVGEPTDAAPRVAIEATPDPDAWLLRVTAREADPKRAVERCNATLQAVVEARLEQQQGDRQREIEALAALLERAAGDEAKQAELRAALQEVELAAITVRTDVRILDSCR